MDIIYRHLATCSVHSVMRVISCPHAAATRVHGFALGGWFGGQVLSIGEGRNEVIQ